MKNIIVKKLAKKGLNNKKVIQHINYEMGEWIGQTNYLEDIQSVYVYDEFVPFIILKNTNKEWKNCFTCENDIYYKEIFNIIKTIDTDIIVEFLYDSKYNWLEDIGYADSDIIKYIKSFKELKYINGKPWKLSKF